MRGRRVAPANCEMLDWAFRRTGSLRFIGRCFLGESLKRGEASSDMNASAIRRDGVGQKSRTEQRERMILSLAECVRGTETCAVGVSRQPRSIGRIPERCLAFFLPLLVGEGLLREETSAFSRPLSAFS